MGVDLGERKDAEPLEVLNALAREARDRIADPSAAERSQGWAVVVDRMRRTGRRSVVLRWAVAGVLTAASVTGALALLPSTRYWPGGSAGALAYEIRGGEVVDGGYLRESAAAGIALRFVEGTEMSFRSGTRGRLRSISSTGARVAIEHGEASFRINPRPGADWAVEVGPFVVTVKGTVFTVSWDAVNERLAVTLERGAVSVTGPVSSGPVLLAAGQRLAVDLPKRQSIISEAAADGTWPVAGLPVPPPASGSGGGEPRPLPGMAPSVSPPPLSPPTERATAAVRPRARRGWAQAVASGDWDRILADVDRAGVSETLSQASSDDLLALADAARYRRRADLARSALLAERRRFPGSTSALEAAYLLGRLSESSAGPSPEALRWYDVYLTGAPAGPYASEALGRKMTATNQLRGAAAAQALAQEYLRRFPEGSYAGAARALLSSVP